MHLVIKHYQFQPQVRANRLARRSKREIGYLFIFVYKYHVVIVYVCLYRDVFYSNTYIQWMYVYARLLHFEIKNNQFGEFRKYRCENKAPFSRNIVQFARAVAWLYRKMTFSRTITRDTELNYINGIRMISI